MATDQVCLKWNNFPCNITKNIDDLWKDESLVDVTICSEGQCIQAHKVILSASSPLFKSLFAVNPCQHPIIILQDVQYRELTAIITFIYKGEVNIDEQHLPFLLKAAKTLQIRGLSDTVETIDTSLFGAKTGERSSKKRKIHSITESNKEDCSVNLAKDIIPKEEPEHDYAADYMTQETDDEDFSKNEDHVNENSQGSLQSDSGENNDPMEICFDKIVEKPTSSKEDESSLQEESPMELLSNIFNINLEKSGVNTSSQKLQRRREDGNLYNQEPHLIIVPPPNFNDEDSGSTNLDSKTFCYIRKAVALEMNPLKVEIMGLKTLISNLNRTIQEQFIIDIENTHVESTNELPPFPLTKDAFVKLNVVLETDASLTNQFTSAFGRIGGRNPGNSTRKILNSLLRRDIAEHFSWCGLRNKLPLKDMYIMKLIITIVMNQFGKSRQHDVETAIAGWFRHTSHRSKSATAAKETEIMKAVLEDQMKND